MVALLFEVNRPSWRRPSSWLTPRKR